MATQTSAAAPDAESDDVPWWAIAIGVVGLLLVLIAAALLVVFKKRKQRPSLGPVHAVPSAAIKSSSRSASVGEFRIGDADGEYQSFRNESAAYASGAAEFKANVESGRNHYAQFTPAEAGAQYASSMAEFKEGVAQASSVSYARASPLN